MGNDKNDFTLNRADSALLARDFSLAARLYRTVLASDPTNKNVCLKLASTYVKAGQDDKAEGAYLNVLRLDSSNFEALNSLGGVFRRLGKYQDSIKVLDRALKIKDSSEVKYNMGFTYKLMEKYEEAAECFTAVIDANPNDVLAYNHLGAIYAKRGDHKKALQTYWKGLQVDQNHPVLHYNSALSFIAQGEYDEARESFENALRAKPGWPDAMNGLAELYMHEQNYSEAQELISQGLKINPENLNLEVTQGRLHVRRGNYAEAESVFRSVLEKRPNDYAVMGRLERVYEKQNMFDEAYSVLDRMNQNEASAGDAGKKDLTCRKIQLLINQGKLKDAGELLNQERASSPNDPDVLNLLSQYFIRAGKTDKAHGCFKRLCEVKPGAVNFLWDAAMQFKRMGDYANAEDYMHKYLEKRSDNPEALCCLGDIYEDQKQYEKSLEVFKKVLEKDMSNPRLEEAVSRVGAHVDTNKRDTADMSELLADDTGDKSPEELQEKIRLYENSVGKLEKFAVSEDQKPDDNAVGDDIDSVEKIDFDELLKLEYKDGDDSDMESDYSNLIMEEDSPVDFESEEFDDRKKILDNSDLVPKDMPFEFTAGSEDDSGFNPLDYNYTPKYSPSEQNEILDVDGSPFEDDDFDKEETVEEKEPERYPQPCPAPYPQQPQYPQASPRNQGQQPMQYQQSPAGNVEPAITTPEPQPMQPQMIADPDMMPAQKAEQSPSLMDSGFEDDPDVPPAEMAVPSETMQEPAPADGMGEPFADNAFGDAENALGGEPEAKPDDDIPFDGIGEPFADFGNDGVDEGALLDDDMLGGTPDEEKPFYEEDVEPGDEMLMPDEDSLVEETAGEPEADEATEPETYGTPDEDDVSEPETSEGDVFEPDVSEAAETDSVDEPQTQEPSAEEDPSDRGGLLNAAEHDAAGPDSADAREARDSAEETPHDEENLHRDEKTTMNLVSDALQNVMNAPVKKDFRDAADMFKTLRTLSSSLPQVQKDAFFNSLNKLKLDYVIERLSGKPGLLSAASAIRKTGGIAGMKTESKPSLLKTMTYMRTLIKSLPDASQSWLLGKEVDKLINKAQQ